MLQVVPVISDQLPVIGRRSSVGGRQKAKGRRQKAGDYFYLFSPHPTPPMSVGLGGHTPHPTPHTRRRVPLNRC
jgi:hypothetical protein